MEAQRVKTVKVIVYCARNLIPQKGEREPLSWAVFGFGEEKCCTRQIRNRNPKWNEESTFTITDSSAPLLLVVKDDKDVLGQIVIAAHDLPSNEHFLKWVPMVLPDNDIALPGQVCMDCWIDDHDKNKNLPLAMPADAYARSKSCQGYSSTSGVQFRPRSTSSPLWDANKQFKSRASVYEMRNRHRLSMQPTSMQPTHSYRPLSGCGFPQIQEANPRMNNALLANAKERNHPLFELNDKKIKKVYPPKMRQIVPTSGPAKGGTLIQITGKYLGASKEDIIKCTVAGCDCLQTLQFYSSNKIMVTTHACTGIGPITIETRSGGVSSSKILFEFVEEKVIIEKCATRVTCNEELENVKNENKVLRNYIDKLHAYLMIHYPDALDVKNVAKVDI